MTIKNEIFKGKISFIKRYLPHNNLFSITLLLPQKYGLTSMARLHWQMGTKRPVTKDRKGGKATRCGHVIHLPTQKILSALGARRLLRSQKEIYLKFLSGHSRSPFKGYRIYSPSHLLCCCGFVLSILSAFLDFLSHFHFRFCGKFFPLTLFLSSSLCSSCLSFLMPLKLVGCVGI